MGTLVRRKGRLPMDAGSSARLNHLAENFRDADALTAESGGDAKALTAETRADAGPVTAGPPARRPSLALTAESPRRADLVAWASAHREALRSMRLLAPAGIGAL